MSLFDICYFSGIAENILHNRKYERRHTSGMLKARGGSGVKKNKFGLYQSPTCHGVTTFYGIAKSSFMTKIWRVKVRGYYSVPYKI